MLTYADVCRRMLTCESGTCWPPDGRTQRLGYVVDDTSSTCTSIRQHTSAYVSISQQRLGYVVDDTSSTRTSIRQHTSAYVSIRQHTSAYVSIRQHTSAYVSIRQHTSAYVSIRQHTSAKYSTIQAAPVITQARVHKQLKASYSRSSRPHTAGRLSGGGN